MNRMNNFLLMGSVALSGIVAFSACSSENDMGAEVNPTFDGKTVKTQFALNVPYGDTGTRMSANAAQQNRNFRGISNMKLLSLTATPAAGTIPTSLIDLSTASESDGNTFADQGRYIYSDVVIPVGTKNFIFYGKATETTTTPTDKEFENGYLSNNLTGATVANLDNINFGLEIINTLELTNEEAGINKSYNKVLKALQDVTNTEVTVGATTIKWNDITTSTTDAKLDQAKNLWNAFKTLKAGSANSVRITLEHLKTTAGVTALAEGEAPTANGDGLLKTLVKNIDAALTTLGTDNTFPADLNLPDGAVGVKYDEASNKWSFNSSVTMNENTIDYKKITYPASLDYFVSSPAKAKDNASTGLTDAMWPAKDKWTKDEPNIWDGWDNEVKRTSRTIALEKAIQYGVANLQLTINAAANTLEDNAKDNGGRASNQNVFVTDNKLVMTGVLIGGQPTQVEWNYEPKTTGTTFDLTIYDKKMNGATPATENGIYVPVNTPSNANYTLVLDNNNNASAKSIYVAVELVNKTGIDFYGADGMIPAGGKFYLVGKLDPEAATGVTGKTATVDRVFLKDYTTKANLTIKDLKNAYNVIPDLRSTAISVGLAVNLEWQEGITFDVEI